eukprot:scaffold4384_cov367-Prasinococcus_capsulatus_cf.AAC.10
MKRMPLKRRCPPQKLSSGSCLGEHAKIRLIATDLRIGPGAAALTKPVAMPVGIAQENVSYALITALHTQDRSGMSQPHVCATATRTVANAQ